MAQSMARAALIYQDPTSARDQQIADEVNARVVQYRSRGEAQDQVGDDRW
ncbi:hypothetical protein [Amycolatopsis thermoflava]